MNFSSYVALRYLRAKRDNRFISLITGFSLAGVALGVATLIVTLSVMDGFEDALKSRLASGEFHILVTRAGELDEPYFTFPMESIAKVYEQSPDILSVNPVLTTEAILRVNKRVSGMTLRGISDTQMNEVAKVLVEAKPGPKTMSDDGLWLGRELAYELNVSPGDKVSVISPTETEGPLESVPRLKSFHVDGIYETGIPEKDLHVAYAPMAAVRDFLRKPNQVNQIEVQVHDFENSKPTADKIRAALGSEFTVKDWEQLNAHLFASLRLEKITMFLILAIIVLVASFNIVTSLKMTVIEKRKEISILQAMGASAEQIRRIFLIQGAIVGLLGTLLGAFLGLLVAVLLKRYQFIELPEIFFDRSLPVVISPVFVVLIVLVAFSIVLFASIFPARSAVKLTPLEGIRDL